MEKLSPLLAKILVVVSFHWNVGKLNYLSTTIDNVLRYPSEVHTCITTNRPERLKRVFAAWELPADSVWVCPEPATPDNDTYRYALLWRHRAVIGAAASGAKLSRGAPVTLRRQTRGGLDTWCGRRGAVYGVHVHGRRHAGALAGDD